MLCAFVCAFTPIAIIVASRFFVPRSVFQGLHPRVIADGFELARAHTVKFLEGFKVLSNFLVFHFNTLILK